MTQPPVITLTPATLAASGHDDDLTLTLTEQARKSLSTIGRGWRYVLDPIQTNGGGTTRGGIRPATEDDIDHAPDARLDTPRTLAFWVHAALDEWPTILQTLQPVDADKPDGKLHLVTTETIDCADVPAMVDLLHREAGRIASWIEPGQDYGATFVSEVAELARVVSRVAWPPKGDRLTIGECPECGRRVRVKAPTWHKRPLSVPQPTTNPAAYAAWTWVVPDGTPWEADRSKPITCRCGIEDDLEGWRERMTGPPVMLTAEQIVDEVREHLGMRYQTASVRQWARRGLITSHGYSKQGHALYDRTQVLAALIDREKKRDRAS